VATDSNSGNSGDESFTWHRQHGSTTDIGGSGGGDHSLDGGFAADFLLASRH
jgi:hypothetical protein